MHVFIDDSGDGGMKFSQGSTSHLIMSACVFRDPKEIERLADAVEKCLKKSYVSGEYKYSKINRRARECFFDCTEDIDYAIRAIIIDKKLLRSNKLRTEPSSLKSYAIRMLLTKNYGQIKDAKIVIDGQDTKAFGIDDSQYLMRMVNSEVPGTIKNVKFDDSRRNVGIQLADMTAGAINHAVRTNKGRDDTSLRRIRRRAVQPRGTYWFFK
jgi:hypothetical protein